MTAPVTSPRGGCPPTPTDCALPGADRRDAGHVGRTSYPGRRCARRCADTVGSVVRSLLASLTAALLAGGLVAAAPAAGAVDVRPEWGHTTGHDATLKHG